MIVADRFVEASIAPPIGLREAKSQALFAKTQRSEIDNMAGIQRLYEGPVPSDLSMDVALGTLEYSVDHLISGLVRRGKI